MIQIKRVEGVVLGLLAFVLVLNCSIFGKGIWIDEVVQFALGAADSTAQAWRMFHSTAGTLNHGQTGLYYMLDHWLLRAFGASTFWLRFPTFVCALWLFFGMRHLFNQWKLPFHWQLWGFLTVSATPTLTFYMSEARPYLPLAACVIGALAYYYTPIEARKRPAARALGWGSVIVGAMMHPYFAVYWLYVTCIPYVQRLLENSERPSVRAFLAHANLRLSVTGTILYFTVAAVTWLGHPAGKMNMNPFEWLPKEVPFVYQVLLAHFQVFDGGGVVAFLFVFAFSGLALWSVNAVKKHYPALVGAQLLGIGALALTSLVSYMSYRVNYWIVHRQWIASVALSVVGTTLFVALVAKMLNRRAAIVWTLLVFAFSGFHGIKGFQNRAALSQELLGDSSPFYAVRYLMGANGPVHVNRQVSEPKSNDDYEAIANSNAKQGGPVDKRMLGFYPGH